MCCIEVWPYYSLLINYNILPSENIYGPYGGNGGRFFEAIPPEPYTREGKRIHCFLGWISGQSDQRLDGISFHWKCPKEPSHVYPEEYQSYTREYQMSSINVYESSANAKVSQYKSYLILVMVLLICISNIQYNLYNLAAKQTIMWY